MEYLPVLMREGKLGNLGRHSFPTGAASEFELHQMLSFRRASQSKALVALASAPASSDRMVHTRSHFTLANCEEKEGLFKYTRGRWLYNEREREYLVYALYHTA